MFVLAEMSDTVRLAPFEFQRDFETALEKALNKKLSNKVVLNVGLCICLYDFVKVADSFLLPGDGGSHTKVDFRFVVFRPFIDEVLLGKVRAGDKDGLQISITFFDDIHVPAEKLPVPSKFQYKTIFSDAVEQVWYWEQTDDDGNVVKLFMDPRKSVRFRVVDERFCDTQPSSGAVNTAESVPTTPVSGGGEAESTGGGDDSNRRAQVPYLVIGSLAEAGLGCLEWWTSAEEEEQDDG